MLSYSKCDYDVLEYFSLPGVFIVKEMELLFADLKDDGFSVGISGYFLCAVKPLDDCMTVL